MNKDNPEVYKDEKLLKLAKRMVILNQEEFEFFFSDAKIINKGRALENITRDMIAVYEETNKYIEANYPDNALGNSWIGTNQFSVNLLKERISDS